MVKWKALYVLRQVVHTLMCGLLHIFLWAGATEKPTQACHCAIEFSKAQWPL